MLEPVDCQTTDVELRVCARCQVPQAAGSFGIRKASASGLNPWCRECCNAYARERSANPERTAREAECRRQRNAPHKVKARRAVYDRERRSRPEVKERDAVTQRERLALPEGKARHDAYRRKWRKDHPEESRLHSRNNMANRRARLIEAECEPIDYRVLYDRDRGRCHLCLRKCSFESGSIDHVIPISQGGDHLYTNVKLACLSCNSSKGNRPVPGGEQLLLIG